MGTFETYPIILVLVDTRFVADFLTITITADVEIVTPTCELLHEIFWHIDS